MDAEPAGFVEPDPEFFARMAGLARGTKSFLQNTGDFESVDYQAVAEQLRYFERTCGDLKTRDEFEDKFQALPGDEKNNLLLAYALLDEAPTKAKRGSAEQFAESKAWLITLAGDIENNRIDQYPDLKKSLDYTFGHLLESWEQLELLCRQLESLAHKQLRGIEFSEVDNLCIGNYGKALADLMFYRGNSYHDPRDDAPRVVDVYTRIDEKGQTNLEVGVARARELLVLYPWKGKAVLCHGAIMPYYEFSGPTCLDDAEWKTLLDSGKRPAVPGWFAPIVEGNSLSAPSFKK